MLNGSPHKKKTGKTPHMPLVTRWGIRIKDIRRRDVPELLDEIVERGAPIMANRTLALVRKMFDFAIEREWLETNPCHLVKRVAPERQRQRVLSEDEIRAVWTALDDEHPIIAVLFRIRRLTAQRGGAFTVLRGKRWASRAVGGRFQVCAARTVSTTECRCRRKPFAF